MKNILNDAVNSHGIKVIFYIYWIQRRLEKLYPNNLYEYKVIFKNMKLNLFEDIIIGDKSINMNNFKNYSFKSILNKNNIIFFY